MQKLQIKEEILVVAALLALGTLAIMPGVIAGSALTTSTNQVPNVVTQASVALCGYISGWWSDWGRFAICMGGTFVPTSFAARYLYDRGTRTVNKGQDLISQGKALGEEQLVKIGMQLVRTGAFWLRFTPVGFAAAVA